MNPTLCWTIIGAIGSSLGALIGAIALIIALKAYFQPLKIALSAKISNGIIANQLESFSVYSISVHNKGIREITVTNISLKVGDRTLFLDMLPQGTVLMPYEPQFPVKLSQGTSVALHLPYDRFNLEIARLVKQSHLNLNERVMIAVRDGTDAVHQFKTGLRVKSFIR